MATYKPSILVGKENMEESHESSNVADPDPYVFGSPGSGSISQITDPDPYIISKISKKNLGSNCFVTVTSF